MVVNAQEKGPAAHELDGNDNEDEEDVVVIKKLELPTLEQWREFRKVFSRLKRRVREAEAKVKELKTKVKEVKA